MSSLYLVEDHLVVRQGLRMMLEAIGHSVVGESSDPTQVLSDLQRLMPVVVLLDLDLGSRSGFEVLAEIQSRALRPRCIVLTMFAQPRHVAQAVRLGAFGYVLKTDPVSELKMAIEEALQGRRYLGSAVTRLAIQALVEPVGTGDVLDKLSPRERQIIKMVVKGCSSAAIGQELHLAAKTVDTYRSRLMLKLEVHDVPALVRLAIRAGIINLD